VRGPVKIAQVATAKATPVGHSLAVYRKTPRTRAWSHPLPSGQPAPMPWSVFFADGGIAFHSGQSHRSSRAVSPHDPRAHAWFNYMAIGDQFQVVKASQDCPAQGQPPVGKKPGQIDPLRGPTTTPPRPRQ